MNTCDRLNDFVEIFTISDMWHNAEKLFRYPINLFLEGIPETSRFYRFFEFDCETGTGFVSFSVSIFIWYLGFFIIADFFEKIFAKKEN